MTLQDLKVVNSYLKSCFLIFPNYNLGHGLMEMAYNEYLNEYYAKIGRGGAVGAGGREEGGRDACLPVRGDQGLAGGEAKGGLQGPRHRS